MTDVDEVEITKAILVRASPARVYDAFATADGLDGWFTEGASVDARPGGMIRFRWKNWGPNNITAQDDCPVLEAIRPTRLVFQEHPEGSSQATTIEINFIPHAQGAVVRLREYGFSNTLRGRHALVRQAGGWGEALALLKFYVEHGLRY